MEDEESTVDFSPKNTMMLNLHTYKSHGFIWPDCESQTSAIHDPRCAHSRKQDHTDSTEPRQDHADCGHPVAIVLAVSNGVHDLEVAFQRDDDKAKSAGCHTEGGQCNAVKEYTFLGAYSGQEIGSEERLRNDLSRVEWNMKP